MNQEQMQQLENLLEEMQAIFMQEANVHDYTNRLGDICRIFIEFDDMHIHSLARSPSIDVLAQEVISICPEHLKENVRTTLTSICNAQAVDDETKLPLQALLRRTWALRNIYANGTELVCQNLSHNIETEGGCLPGIAARLVQPYTAFLYNALQQSMHASSYSSAHVNAGYYNEQQLLEQALRLSLLENHPNKSGVGTFDDVDDDENTELAYAISLSLAPPPQAPLVFSSANPDNMGQQTAPEQSIQAAAPSDEELALQLHLQLNH